MPEIINNASYEEKLAQVESNKAGRNILRVGASALLLAGLVAAVDETPKNNKFVLPALGLGTGALVVTAAKGRIEQEELAKSLDKD